MVRKPFIAAVVVWLSLIPSLKAEERDFSSFQVIVNTRNPVNILDRKFVADLFFKKITHWPDDEIVQPVDLKSDSPTRRKFSENVLKRTVMGVKNYWQQLIFSGRDVPPLELSNDEEVIKYVIQHHNAIGYISAVSKTGNKVKIISLK